MVANLLCGNEKLAILLGIIFSFILFLVISLFILLSTTKVNNTKCTKSKMFTDESGRK